MRSASPAYPRSANGSAPSCVLCIGYAKQYETLAVALVDFGLFGSRSTDARPSIPCRGGSGTHRLHP